MITERNIDHHFAKLRRDTQSKACYFSHCRVFSSRVTFVAIDGVCCVSLQAVVVAVHARE